LREQVVPAEELVVRCEAHRFLELVRGLERIRALQIADAEIVIGIHDQAPHVAVAGILLVHPPEVVQDVVPLVLAEEIDLLGEGLELRAGLLQEGGFLRTELAHLRRLLEVLHRLQAAPFGEGLVRRRQQGRLRRGDGGRGRHGGNGRGLLGGGLQRGFPLRDQGLGLLILGIGRRQAPELRDGARRLAGVVEGLGAGDRIGAGGVRSLLGLGVGEELVPVLEDVPAAGRHEHQDQAPHQQELLAGPAVADLALRGASPLGRRELARIGRDEDLFLEIVEGTEGLQGEHETVGGGRGGGRHGRRRGRCGRTGGDRDGPGLDLLQVFAGRGIAGLDLEDLLEDLPGSLRVAGLEARHAIVEDLFHLALGFGLEPARLIDPARRLRVVDVDQEDPRPGVDGALRVSLIEGPLPLVEELLDAGIAVAAPPATIAEQVDRGVLQRWRVEAQVEAGHLGRDRAGIHLRRLRHARALAAEGRREAVQSRMGRVERPGFVEQAGDLAGLSALEGRARLVDELLDVRLGLHPLLRLVEQTLQLRVGGDGGAVLLRHGHELLEPALLEQPPDLHLQIGREALGGQIGQLEAEPVEAGEEVRRGGDRGG
jgi:hypothetical protein